MPTAKKFPRASRAAYEKPQTAEAYVKKYGADVVRLWVASQDYRNDIVVSEERINKVGETYRAIRNALRYQLSNLYDFDPAKHTVRRRQTDRPRPLDSRRILQAGSRSHRRLRPIRIPRRLSKDQPVHRRRTFGHLPRRGQRPALHRRREFAAPPLDADRAAPPGDAACARCSRRSWRSRRTKRGNLCREQNGSSVHEADWQSFKLSVNEGGKLGKSFCFARTCVAGIGKGASGKTHRQITGSQSLDLTGFR